MNVCITFNKLGKRQVNPNLEQPVASIPPHKPFPHHRPQPTPWRGLSFSPPLNTIAHSHENNKFAHKVYRGVPRRIKRAGVSHSKHFFLEQIGYTGRTLIYQQNL